MYDIKNTLIKENKMNKNLVSALILGSLFALSACNSGGGSSSSSGGGEAPLYLPKGSYVGIIPAGCDGINEDESFTLIATGGADVSIINPLGVPITFPVNINNDPCTDSTLSYSVEGESFDFLIKFNGCSLNSFNVLLVKEFTVVVRNGQQSATLCNANNATFVPIESASTSVKN